MTRKRGPIIKLSVLPGEPTDGSGRACIHLFVRDNKGPFVEPHALYPAIDHTGQVIKGKLIARPTRGRLACNPKRTVAPVVRDGVVTVTQRTDDARAVTCPKCIASSEYRETMERLKET